MRGEEARRAIAGQLRARAAWGYPHDLSSTRAEGQVIGCSEGQMVLIRTDSGEQIWWAAELTELASPATDGGTDEPR